MNRSKWLGIVTVACMAAWFVAGEARAQKTKGKTRPLTTKQMMKGWTGPANTELKKALEAESVDWDAVKLQAALLNEQGYVLMDDGRCPDEIWAKSSKALQTTAAVLLEKAEAKDLEGSKAAHANLIAQTCRVCHPVHKGK
ncbi:MAG: hypothetical protein IT428_01285 [Planctomycetaceae bacterium]|nr:hypothetical protein [Planctomycetaceae bacterium]